jgi:hypothetical protein
MINTVVSLFIELGLLNEEEGEALAKKIRQGTLPADFSSSRRQIKEWMKDVKAGK